MTRVGRAKERGETQGFMKVLVDAESRALYSRRTAPDPEEIRALASLLAPARLAGELTGTATGATERSPIRRS